MSRVEVDPAVCHGCTKCLDACPTDVFRMDEVTGRSVAVYGNDCCACLLCIEDCPTGAITVNTQLNAGAFRSIYDQLDGVADVAARRAGGGTPEVITATRQRDETTRSPMSSPPAPLVESETAAITATPVIEVRDVEKVFWEWKRRRFTSVPIRGFRALAPSSFTVAAGEFVSIVGPSGCGKSTLLSMIAGLEPPTAGEIKVGNNTVNGTGGPDTGMVFQNIGLYPWLTAQQNVMFALDGVNKSEAQRRASECLQLVGLENFKDAYPNQLSGGMQQRVAIARALVIEPSLLLMDEPFGALDAQTRMVLQEELLRLRAQWQGSILFVTHDIDEAVYLSDRVIVMSTHPGRIVEIVDVPIPRSRDSITTRADEEYIRIRSRIWRTLRPLTETAADAEPIHDSRESR
jgi:NitT/TauT family transport system ATP-binding protein